jgi:hypothetical protein
VPRLGQAEQALAAASGLIHALHVPKDAKADAKITDGHLWTPSTSPASAATRAPAKYADTTSPAHPCEENQAQFHAQFDRIILLSAPPETLVERLAARTSNSYAKAPAGLSHVLDDIDTVEPLLRQVAGHEVRTTMPLNEVVTTVLRLVNA